MKRTVVLLVITLSMGGCKKSSNGDADAAVASTQPAAIASAPVAPEAMAFADGQTWKGSYKCPQGSTEVLLHISHVSANNVEAVFEFSVPRAPNGKFKASGAYVAATRNLRLNPREWIAQPKGYGMVAVDATVSADGKSYAGTIDAPGCSDFAVHR